jgi:hypothetical protein
MARDGMIQTPSGILPAAMSKMLRKPPTRMNAAAAPRTAYLWSEVRLKRCRMLFSVTMIQVFGFYVMAIIGSIESTLYFKVIKQI